MMHLFDDGLNRRQMLRGLALSCGAPLVGCSSVEKVPRPMVPSGCLSGSIASAACSWPTISEVGNRIVIANFVIFMIFFSRSLKGIGINDY